MKDKDRRPKGKGTPPAASRSGQNRSLSGPKDKPSGPRQVARPSSSRPTPGARAEKAEAWPAASVEAAAPVAAVRIRTGEKPAERIPVILETTGARDYHLIDSGDGLKLEQYGSYRIVRPEAQALWPKALPVHVWENADAVFTGDTDEDGMGRWRFPKDMLGETWPMQILDADFFGRFTSFRHVGVFPEQLAHWSWMKERIETAGRPLKVLNLFGYTGVASLIAARAGAEVTHVDASKKAIGWARENQALGRGEKLPIRWICEDAMKFIQREERRGSRYDIILTDPPKFGRGPNGEVWHLFEHLALMLDICREILSEDARGLVLTAYSIRASFYSIHELMRETMRGRGGAVESGELILREGGLSGKEPARALSTSLFSRWVPK
ncbi:class I SAM-dependent rRNA methyltransferase [Rhizobium sp. 32-5/1]|uniref:class I SAM-dependent rRNA methyltransferase n=1 Tax=Rhizobium sp. 32-5/1 TaxID=3019602 RepID=UPI00240CE765|nr:class I SAM-dependent rRNA methyltransferase [Rhizobium sp. 32-5/1]WEZ84760.1 class I SAM-dependent rRNA methyltransferase [Rhizobium sp. 32-5/1]